MLFMVHQGSKEGVTLVEEVEVSKSIEEFQQCLSRDMPKRELPAPELPRKKKPQAISTELIILISFVLICVAFYKAVIQGAYWGVALHTVSEINNESYVYYSSSDESEVCEKRSTKSSINDNNFRKGQMYGKELFIKERRNVSLQNPETSNYSLSSQPYSKRGTMSQKPHDN